MDSISNSSSPDPNGNQFPSPPESNCNAVSLQPVTKDTVEERQSRIQRQEEWAGKQTMNDVIFNKELSEIASIGGFKLDHFRHRMLIKFCRGNGIIVPSNKQKKDDCILYILNHKKNAGTRAKVASTMRNKNKSTKPSVVTTDGTMYRVCLTITHGLSRDTYMETLKNATRVDIEAGSLMFKGQFKTLCLSYNDNTNQYLDTLGDPDGKYMAYANDDVSKTFDVLNEQAMSDIISYLNFTYRTMRKRMKVSGTHTTPVEDFIQGKGWLLFYHDKLSENGNKGLMDCAYAQLPQDAFMTSSMETNTSYTSPSRSVSHTSSILIKRNVAKSKEAMNIATELKNNEIAKVAAIQVKAKAQQLKSNNLERFENLEDKIFELSEEYNSIKGDESKRNRRKFVKSKILRLRRALDEIKKDMNYKEIDEELSSDESF